MIDDESQRQRPRALGATISFLLLFGTLVTSAHAQTWQQSSSPQVELGIRDKHGNKGSYLAEFVVVDAKGQSVVAKLRVKEGQFGTILFPRDFKTHFVAGKYAWTAKVDGKAVVKGQFVYETVGTGQRVTAMY